MAKVADGDMCIPGNALPPLHILVLKTHILLSPLATAAGTSGLETAPVLNEVGCWTARPSHVLQSFHVWLFILFPLCQGPLKGTSTIVFAFSCGELQAHTAMPNVYIMLVGQALCLIIRDGNSELSFQPDPVVGKDIGFIWDGDLTQPRKLQTDPLRMMGG